MKTAEVLDKYRKILSGILKCDPENILLYIRKSGNWSDVGHFDYDKKQLANIGSLVNTELPKRLVS